MKTNTFSVIEANIIWRFIRFLVIHNNLFLFLDYAMTLLNQSTVRRSPRIAILRDDKESYARMSLNNDFVNASHLARMKELDHVPNKCTYFVLCIDPF